MKIIENSQTKVVSGTIKVTLTDQDIYSMLEEKGIFLDLPANALEYSIFSVRHTCFNGENEIDSDCPLSCTLEWRISESC